MYYPAEIDKNSAFDDQTIQLLFAQSSVPIVPRKWSLDESYKCVALQTVDESVIATNPFYICKVNAEDGSQSKTTKQLGIIARDQLLSKQDHYAIELSINIIRSMSHSVTAYVNNKDKKIIVNDPFPRRFPSKVIDKIKTAFPGYSVADDRTTLQHYGEKICVYLSGKKILAYANNEESLTRKTIRKQWPADMQVINEDIRQKRIDKYSSEGYDITFLWHVNLINSEVWQELAIYKDFSKHFFAQRKKGAKQKIYKNPEQAELRNKKNGHFQNTKELLSPLVEKMMQQQITTEPGSIDFIIEAEEKYYQMNYRISPASVVLNNKGKQLARDLSKQLRSCVVKRDGYNVFDEQKLQETINNLSSSISSEKPVQKNKLSHTPTSFFKKHPAATPAIAGAIIGGVLLAALIPTAAVALPVALCIGLAIVALGLLASLVIAIKNHRQAPKPVVTG